MTKRQIFQETLDGSLRRFQDLTAIEHGDRRIGYRQLKRSSNLLAARLQQAGIVPHTLVGIWLEDRIDLIIAVIAVLKVGGVFVPLDPSLPEERLAEMIRHTALRYLVTGNGVSLVAEEGLRTIDIRQSTPASEADDEWDVSGAAASWDENDPIYVYFTSGSSGTPKAILGKNKSLLHFIQWEIDTFGPTEGYRVSQFITPGFDAFLRDIFVPLLCGGTICVPENLERLLEQKRLAAWLEENRINLVHCVPSLFRMIDPKSLSPHNLPQLRSVLLSGERILSGDIEGWLDLFGDRIQLVNLYGPTETTMIKTFYILSARDLEKDNIPVGKPMRGSRVVIFDSEMAVCDPLTTGELYIRTPFRTHGYLNDPVLTNQRFIPNPLSGDPGDLLYRTGDLGRYLADGDIELSGRLDRQVKIRGIRVELGEIEAALMIHPEISEAAVLVHELSIENQLLLAYITGSRPDDLEEFLGLRLPPYMIPNRVQAVPALPRLPNRKIDYNTLKSYYQRYMKERIPPRDSTEERILAIWRQVLTGHDAIGVTDNFFELGGNSLNVMALLTRVHKEMDIRLSLGDIFRNRTVESQAALVNQSAPARYSRIPAAEDRPYYRLSPAQTRLYILQQMDPHGTGYNMPQVLEFTSPPDINRLQNAFERLIARHQILRTSFYLIDGEPKQHVHAGIPFALETTSYEDEAAAIAGFLRPFQLDKPPLVRACILRGSGVPGLMVVDMHHIITDGISQRLLIKDFLALYDGRKLPELRIHYKDYVEWQAGEDEKEAAARQEDYWLRQLSGEIPRVDLPFDFPRPAVQSSLGGSLRFVIEQETKDRLHRLAAQMDVTLYMLLLAVFNIFLSKTGNQEDILVGTPVTGRKHADLESMLGLFVNTLVMRNRIRADASFATLLQQTKKTALEAFENQEYPFEELVGKIAVTRDVSRSPLFDSFFALDTVESGLAAQYDLDMVWRDYEVKTSKFDLMLAAGVADDRLTFRFIYGASLFKKTTIQRFSEYLNCIIDSILDDPHANIAAIDIVPAHERLLLLQAFNDTDAPIPTHPYHVQFTRQAARTPNSPAITFHDQTITYSELDKTSNQWANWLIARGLEPNRAVAVIIERSIRMAQAILAIWKAGCHYIPIDPQYPEQRIRTILANAVVTTVITAENLDEWLQASSHPPSVATSIHDPAYIIFTSGSTGSPKGAVVEHLGMMNHLQIKIDDLDINERTIMAQSASHTFDISVWQYFCPLLRGGMSIVYPTELVLETQRYIQLVGKDRITVLQTVPSYLAVLLDTLAYNPVPLPELRHLIVIGEAVKPDLVNQWLTLYPGTPMVNGYGPTEASDNVTHYIMTEPVRRVDVPLGKPLPNIKLYVVDKEMNLCPIGVVGEIVVSGISVGRGYINDVERTAAAFTIDPFQQDPTIRLYKTGDLGRFLEDGTLEFKGRIDYQVKIRGFRIELGEIEHALLGHSQVREAVVVDKKDAGGRTYLCAYIVCHQQGGTKDLKEHLAERLPAYMIPAFFVPLDSMPLTANGKVNRKALPEPDTTAGTGIPFISSGQLRRTKEAGLLPAAKPAEDKREDLPQTEVELALAEYSFIEQAVVVRAGGPGGEHLNGCIVSKRTIDKNDLLEHLRARLGGRLPVIRLLHLEHIPINDDGSIDRQLLESIEIETSHAFQPPSNDMEAIVAGAWQELLNIPQIGITDNFFEIGGNSLSIIQATNRLNHQLELDIPVLKMFEYPTVKSFCAYLEDLRAGNCGAKQDIAAIDTSLEDSLVTMEETLGIIDAYEHE